MPTALLSAFDKTDLVDFARSLQLLGWDLLGSQGTAKYLDEHGVSVLDVAEIVGPPILGHKVVTLSREIHAALLADDTPEEQAELDRIDVPRIDLLYVNLYPLEQEAKNPARTLASILGKTDIGGPTMLRSAAKGRRIVLHSQSQFQYALGHLARRQDTTEEDWRKFIAGLVFNVEMEVSRYCSISASAQFETSNVDPNGRM